jgi:hypothetical protein
MIINNLEIKGIVVLIHCYMRNRMHSPNIKIINANLAYCINQYKNTKRKLLIYNANISTDPLEFLMIACI